MGRWAGRHDNALSPLGERVARDGGFISRRGSGEGVLFRCLNGREGSLQLFGNPLRLYTSDLGL